MLLFQQLGLPLMNGFTIVSIMDALWETIVGFIVYVVNVFYCTNQYRFMHNPVLQTNSWQASSYYHVHVHDISAPPQDFNPSIRLRSWEEVPKSLKISPRVRPINNRIDQQPRAIQTNCWLKIPQLVQQINRGAGTLSSKVPVEYNHNGGIWGSNATKWWYTM